MIVKFYGLYDGVQKEFVRTFQAKNDDDASRACKYIVNEKGFDDIAGKDMSVQHLYDFDNETGSIVDNSIRPVCNLATFIEERKQLALELATKQKLLNDEFVSKLQESILQEAKLDGARKQANN